MFIHQYQQVSVSVRNGFIEICYYLGPGLVWDPTSDEIDSDERLSGMRAWHGRQGYRCQGTRPFPLGGSLSARCLDDPRGQA